MFPFMFPLVYEIMYCNDCPVNCIVKLLWAVIEMVIGSKDQCIILNVKHQTQGCWAQISQTPRHLNCSTTALFNSAFHMLLKLSKSWANWKCLLNSNQAVTYPACAHMRLRVNLKCLLHLFVRVYALFCTFTLCRHTKSVSMVFFSQAKRMKHFPWNTKREILRNVYTFFMAKRTKTSQ